MRKRVIAIIMATALGIIAIGSTVMAFEGDGGEKGDESTDTMASEQVIADFLDIDSVNYVDMGNGTLKDTIDTLPSSAEVKLQDGNRKKIDVAWELDEQFANRMHLTYDTDSYSLADGVETPYAILSRGSMLSTFSISRSASSGTCSISRSGSAHYGSWATGRYTVATDAGSFTGYCSQPTYAAPSGRYAYTTLNNNRIKLLCVIGPGGDWYRRPMYYNYLNSAAMQTWVSDDYGLVHAGIGVIYSGSYKGLTGNQRAWVGNLVSQVDIWLSYPEIVNELSEYTLYVSSGGSYQDIVWVEKTPKGKLYLQKVSSNTSITNGNSLYSLKDAQYGVYKDSGCTNKVATLATDANGKSNTVELDTGTYYVKETSAPKGYELDTKVYTVNVTSGGTATVGSNGKVTDIVNFPLMGTVKKVDSEIGKSDPQGDATFSGAQFTVKFYPSIQSETDPAESGKTPARTWVFETDSEGKIVFDEKHKLSGNDFYGTDGNGNMRIPLGTITLQETKSPEGYLLNSKVYVESVTTNKTTVFENLEIPEDILKLTIIKKEQGFTVSEENGNYHYQAGKLTDTVIPGAVFRHTKPDGTTEDVTTDENGEAVLKGLTYGQHTIEEISVPDGYSVNPGKVMFTVAEDNTITLDSNTQKTKDGVMKFTVQQDGCAELTVGDVPAPFKLLIHKQNEKDLVLEGAEFTLYADKECTKKLKTAVSDADGEAAFSGLEVGKVYYLKETEAPEGYRIPVNEDGSDIIYTIEAKSKPLEDFFSYSVNGKEAVGTSSTSVEKTDMHWLSGTKAEREVNTLVINTTGIQLPETGTHATLILALIGVSMMASALLRMKKRS